MFGGIKKTSYLCTRKKQKASFNDADMHCKTHNIGVWCNGNTADSGPAFSGSSPDTPTKRFPSGNLFSYMQYHREIMDQPMVRALEFPNPGLRKSGFRFIK